MTDDPVLRNDFDPRRVAEAQAQHDLVVAVRSLDDERSVLDVSLDLFVVFGLGLGRSGECLTRGQREPHCQHGRRRERYEPPCRYLSHF